MTLVRLFLRASATTVALAVVLGLLSGGATAVLVAQITSALGRVAEGAWSQQRIAGYFGLGLLALCARIASLSLLNRLQQTALFQLRGDLGRRILSTPLRQLEEAGAHRLQATLTDDVFAISEGLRVLPVVLINASLLAGALGYMAWLSPRLFGALVLLMGLGVASYLLAVGRAYRLLRAAREAQDALFEHFRAITEGTKELQLHGERRADFLRNGLEGTSATLRSLLTRSGIVYAAGSSWGLFVFFVIIGLLLILGPGVGQAAAATLTGFVLAVLYMQQPLSTTMDSLPFLARASVALRKLEALGLKLADGEALPAVAAGTLRTPFESLELVGVTHAYHREQEDRAFVLGPLDLTLRRGELVFLVGGNGSGKTTFAKLLTGLYAPESGELRLNGAPVTAASRERYRQHFSAVFSDFYLFAQMHGLPHAERAAQVNRYLELLQLDRKVRFEDGRLSTTALSTGQRKRLALITAYLEDRPFYVFDEWAADQDPAFKEVFYLQLLPELQRRGKTVLVITHDDRYFHVCSRLLRLDSGRLVEGGGTGAASGPTGLTAAAR